MQSGEVAEVEKPTLAAFVKRLRQRRGWTQRQLAQQAYLGLGTVRKLEQGDKVRVGDRALTVLAEAVCDDEHESAHLRALAGHSDLSLGEAATAADMATLLERLTSIPAAWMLGWGFAAANDRYRELFPGLLESKSMPHWMFEDPRAKAVLPDWEPDAGFVAGLLRHYCVAEPPGGGTAELVADLAATSPEFRRMWDSGVVYVRRPDIDRRVRSRETGAVTRLRESLIPAAAGWLVLCFPSGEDGPHGSSPAPRFGR